MNQSKSLADFRVWVSLIILSIAAVACYAAVVHNRAAAAQASQGPDINKVTRSFVIETANGNVASITGGENNKYEHDFLRVGSQWDRQGDYASQPGGGNELEVCDDGETFYLWVYAHNTVSTRHNHVNEDVLDFRGTAIAKNTTVSIRSTHLSDGGYANRHNFTAVINADNATTKNDQAEIYCDDHRIKLVTTGVDTPEIYTWANEPVNRLRHERAVEVFGAGYSISNPGNIFTNAGSEIGYDGNLPACRYYAAYVKVQVKVVVEPEQGASTGSLEPDVEPLSDVRVAPTEDLPDTGLGSDSLNYGLIALVASVAVALTITQRAAIARMRRDR